MITLYSGSGSGSFQLLGPTSETSFRATLQHALALLSKRGEGRAVELLSQTAFALWNCTNDFNDDFNILYASLPLDQYEAVRQQSDSKENRAAYRKAVEVLSELGIYVRFIVVALDTSKPVRLHKNGLKDSQINRIVYRYIGVEGGYLGDFRYRSHADFYADLDLDINPYHYTGTTRERFIQILSESAPEVQATILSGILKRFPVGSTEKRTQALADEIRQWSTALRSGTAVPHPTPTNASEVVRRALADAEYLLQKSGATSAVDRVHTALHGYQLGLCNEVSIPLPTDANLTQVFKCLRNQHPALNSSGHRSQDIEKILTSLSSILDALNPIRNRASVAHPNAVLLGDCEARLVLNAGRTVFTYLDEKIQAWRETTEHSRTVNDEDMPF